MNKFDKHMPESYDVTQEPDYIAFQELGSNKLVVIKTNLILYSGLCLI